MKILFLLFLLVTIPFLSHATCGAMGGGAGLIYLFGGIAFVVVLLGIGLIWMLFRAVRYFLTNKKA